MHFTKLIKEIGENMDLEKVGKFIADCRKEKSITQAQLASIIGVDRRTISKWENGVVNLDVSVIEKLAKTLDVTVLEILHGERNKGNKPISLNDTRNRIKRFKNKILGGILLVAVIFFIILGTTIFVRDYYNFTTEGILFYKDGYMLNGKVIYNKAKKQIFINKLTYSDIYSGSNDEAITNGAKVILYYKEKELLSHEYVLENDKRNTISNILKNMTVEYTDNEHLIKSIDDVNLTICFLDENNVKQSIKAYLQTY